MFPYLINNLISDYLMLINTQWGDEGQLRNYFCRILYNKTDIFHKKIAVMIAKLNFE